MPPQARIGDKSLIPADTHGCLGCPHTATGPAVAGSANVLVNGRPAIRVNDPGIHAACCGPNTWNAKTGSRSVFINGRAAHRLGDLVRHCGGTGQTIEGSTNVLVGDLGMHGPATNPQAENHWVDVEILDAFGNPFPGVKFSLSGTVSREGVSTVNVISFNKINKGNIYVKLPEHPLVIKGKGDRQ